MSESPSSQGPKGRRSEKPRRSRGTGALMVCRDAAGREMWYGKWRIGGTQVKRRIGPKRVPGTREGLTQTQAEAELRRIIGEVESVPNRGERMTVEDAGRTLMAVRRDAGRKRSTVENYESILAQHIVPFFGARTVDRIERRDVEAYAAGLTSRRPSPASSTSRRSLTLVAATCGAPG